MLQDQPLLLPAAERLSHPPLPQCLRPPTGQRPGGIEVNLFFIYPVATTTFCQRSHLSCSYSSLVCTLSIFRIRDVLVRDVLVRCGLRIRIRGSVPLSNGPGSGSWSFRQYSTFKTQTKKISFLRFLLMNF
jgi:hypothetical protein